MINTRKKQVRALLFTMSNYEKIREWAEAQKQNFEVVMPEGIAEDTLANIVYSPEISHATECGILIRDHKSFRRSDLDTVIRLMQEQNKQVFSVTNGAEPLLPSRSDGATAPAASPDASSESEKGPATTTAAANAAATAETLSPEIRSMLMDMQHVESPILKVLSECRPALRWLTEVETSDEIPEEHLSQVKQLEKLGIVAKKNKSVSLKMTRLKRVLDRESRNLRLEFTLGDLLGNTSLAVHENMAAAH